MKRTAETGARTSSWPRVCVPLLLAAMLLVDQAGASADAAAATTTSGFVMTPGPVPSGPEGSLSAVACPSADCVAVGTFSDPSGTQPALAEHSGGGRWQVDPSPLPSGARTASLAAVSCWSPEDCVAVGSFTDQTGSSGIRRTLAERWNGYRWTVLPTPNPNDGRANTLAGVSCPAPQFCISVGSATDNADNLRPLMERWDGAAWTIQPTPTIAGATAGSLSSIACTSAQSCVAVGRLTDTSKAQQPLAERWDGAAWAVIPTPVPAPGGGRPGPLGGSVWASLSGVSCSSAIACTAVGTSQDYSNKQFPATLAERWDGAAWTIQPTPNQTSSGGAPGDVLTAVSCASGMSCVAVGTVSSNPTTTFAEHWDGTAWTLDSTPLPPGAHGALTGVACAAAGNCTAVGTEALNAGVDQTLAERWNGNTWTRRDSADPTGAFPSGLSAVSCASPTACTAVGHESTPRHAHAFGDDVADQPALAERWDGTGWSIQSVPDPQHGVGTDLRGVSCPTTDACTAVGQYYDGTSGLEVATADRWEKGRWTVQPVPVPPNTWQAILVGVSCASARSCMAVGWYSLCSYCADWPLAASWDGNQWVNALPPYPSGCTGPQTSCEASADLEGVSCPTATSCVAVGTFVGDLGASALSETWDGAAWTIQGVPDPPDGRAALLTGISCPSPTFCTAVGRYDQQDSADPFNQVNRGLAAAWDGTVWRTQAPPTPPDGAVDTILSAVSCTAPTACTAVGTYRNVTARSDGGAMVYSWVTDHTMAERWDGSAWSSVSTVDPVGAPTVALGGVSCIAFDRGSGCMATGSYSYERSALKPNFSLIEQLTP